MLKPVVEDAEAVAGRTARADAEDIELADGRFDGYDVEVHVVRAATRPNGAACARNCPTRER